MKREIELIWKNKNDLKKYPFNPRKKKDNGAIEKIRGLIQAHGFQNPLQIWKNEKGEFEILCGNHRFEAGVQEGMRDFPCIEYHGTKEEAAARVISDNKSNEWTQFDIPMLKEMLVELDTGEIDMTSTGFIQSEIDKLLAHDGGKPEDPDYPITAKFSEKYDYVIIFAKNEIDNINLQEILQCRKEKGYKSKTVGISRVITYERFIELWQSR